MTAALRPQAPRRQQLSAHRNLLEHRGKGVRTDLVASRQSPTTTAGGAGGAGGAGVVIITCSEIILLTVPLGPQPQTRRRLVPSSFQQPAFALQIRASSRASKSARGRLHRWYWMELMPQCMLTLAPAPNLPKETLTDVPIPRLPPIPGLVGLLSGSPRLGPRQETALMWALQLLSDQSATVGTVGAPAPVAYYPLALHGAA